MEIERCQEIDLDFEAHDLMENNQFSEAMCAAETGIDENDHLPELRESTEPEGNQRNGRYNLRKSLAWDSAFFTSAGVLDPDELSSMMTATDKSGKPSLPGIQEEITESSESLSTLESDNLTLEDCEDDLFVDIRASIQRSSKKASNLISSSSKKAATVVDSTAISSFKKEDIVCEDKNPKPGLKKTSGLPTGRISKPQPKQIAKLASGKSIKQDSVRSQAASNAKTGETNSILPRPPKSISSSIPSSTAAAKRDSVGTARVKSECGNSRLGIASSKGTQTSKVSVLGGSRKPFPKPAVSSKSSLLGSSTTSSVQSIRSSTSSDSSVNTSSGMPAKPKSTLMTARRNPGKSSNSSIGPSGCIPNTPSRASTKNKLPSSTLSSHLMSSKISSSVSPASSISDWSSVSSSSSMANQRCHNSRTSFDTSSCKSMDGDNIPLDRMSRENQGVISTSNTSKKSSTQAGTLQAPAKPSGLRMPSPKIGFFDGVKSPARTPNGQKQSESGMRMAVPKNGDSKSVPIRSSNSKLKSVKVPTSRMMTSSSNIKSASPKAPSPVSTEEKSHASSIATYLNKSSSLSLGVENRGAGEICQKAEEGDSEDGVKQGASAGTDAIDKENSNDSNMDGKVGLGDIKTFPDEDVLIKQDHLKKNSDSHATDKGNLDDLNMYKNMASGDIQITTDEDVLINQDLKKNSNSHAIDEENLDDSRMYRTESPGIVESVFDEDVLIKQDNLKKNGESTPVPIRGSNSKLKSAKVPTSRPRTASSNIKPASPKAPFPVSIAEKSHGSNAPSIATDLNDSSILSLGVEGSRTGETCQKAEKVHSEDGVRQVTDAGTDAIDNENLDDSSMDRQVGPEDIKAVFEDVLITQDHFKKNGESTPIPIRSSTSKLKSAKVPTPRLMTASSNIKTASPTAPSPVSIEEKPHASNAPSIATDLNDSSILSAVVEGSGAGEPCQKAEKVDYEDGVRQVADAGTDAIDKESIDDSSMDRQVGPGDIKTVSDEDVLINQDHLEKSSDFHAIDEENLNESSMVKEVGPGDIKATSDEDVLIKQDDHLKKNTDSHVIDEGNLDYLTRDIKTTSDEDVLINQDHLEKNSDSHAINEENLNESSMVREVGPGDIKTTSDEDVLIKQDEQHLTENSDSHTIDEENLDESSMVREVGAGDIKATSDEDVLIKQDDHLTKNSDSHAIDEENLDESSMVGEVGPGDIKAACDEDVLIKQDDHLKKNSDSHAIDEESLDDLSLYNNVASGDIKTISDEDGQINQEDCEAHPICEVFEKENDDKSGTYKNVNGLTCGLNVDTSEYALSLPAVASESPACRVPLALKNTSDSNERIDMPKDLVIQVGAADKTGHALPSLEQKENI